ncbi:MAG: type I methionyl aminopeptidase [Saprospiraceae bacterium]|nr:type I methionyl aminopeptidase [Saprospiraceae bacterium]
MLIKTKDELKGIAEAGKAVAVTLKKMREFTKPGISTKELDDYGLSVLKSFGAVSAPNKDYQFPGCTCISINHEVCHGIPKETTIIKEGDLVNIDVSAELNGFYGDNGGSFIVGEDSQGLQKLVTASQEILNLAIPQIKSGGRIADLGAFIETEAKKRGFTVIRNLCGHGVGKSLHEEPAEIPCFRDRGNKLRFRKNTVIALETFISTKAKKVEQLDDEWTYVTKDKSFVAQHEHTLIVTDGKPVILTKANGI